MGLGKTAQAIRAADLVEARRILVLCPAVARLNWVREFSIFSRRRLPSSPLLSSRDCSTISSTGVIVCSYDLANESSVRRALLREPFSVLLLDESHYLKEPSAQRTRSVFGKDGLAHRAERVWALSGTPAPNHPGEMWVFLHAIGATTLSFQAFLDRYTVQVDVEYAPGRWKQKVVGGRNIPELKSVMAPHLLRRKKDDPVVNLQLPKLHLTDVVVEPTEPDQQTWGIHFDNYLFNPARFHDDIAHQQKILETLVGDIGLGPDGVKVLEGIDPKVKSLRKWTGLRKVGSVVKIVYDELQFGAYDKIVLFAVHKAVLTELQEGLRDFKPVLLYGGTPAEKRDKHIRRFQEDPKCRVFVGQMVAAGTAITLTAAHQVGMVEVDWVPANNSQAIMRCHRIGQTKPVSVRFFSLANSLDQRITQVVRRKTATLTELFS